MDLHRPLIIAHRGGALLALENSAAAFHAAAAAGADAVETDVRQSADGALVCFHDNDLMRLANDPRKVADLDLATLRRLLPHLMTLDEAISASAPLSILLDVKLRDAAILVPIVAVVMKSGSAERVIFGLRDLVLIGELSRLNANLAILALLDDPDTVRAAAAAGAHWFRLWEGDITDSRIAAVRQSGLRLAVMTGQPRNVPAPDEWPPFPVGQIDRAGLEGLLPMKPDAILLDDPHLLVSSV